jgi:glycosyltransferase involved in cell wall biosynthesis
MGIARSEIQQEDMAKGAKCGLQKTGGEFPEAQGEELRDARHIQKEGISLIMNILILSDAFWLDYTGGITKSLVPEVEELIARGHQVVLITRRFKPKALHESINGYQLYRFAGPLEGSAFYRLYPFFSIRQVPKLVMHLHREFRFDVAYAHNLFQTIGLLRCKAHMPYVYTFHAPISREIEIDAAHGKYGFAAPLVKAGTYWIRAKEKQALSRAQMIIVRSTFMEEALCQLYGDVGIGRTVRIPLCVNGQRFSFLKDSRLVRDELKLPLDRPILFTVRRLVARMGLENLITSMALIVKEIPEVCLIVGGKGYLESFLRRRVEELRLRENVRFLGFIPEEKLPKYYQAADWFVLPTMALEGFGLATIEALSCGTPVIATHVGANPEVLEPLGNEFLCEDRSPEALAERIIWFIKRGVCADLRRRCRDYCQTYFGIEKVVESIEQVLEKAIQYDSE